jgi:hypothetical protein
VNYEINLEAGTLRMTVTPEEQSALQLRQKHSPAEFGSDDFMRDLLENIIANDCFEWVDPTLAADLTDAPILGIFGDEETGKKMTNEELLGSGLQLCGTGSKFDSYLPLLYRWAFMSYQVTTPQAQLAEQGYAVWEGGVVLTRSGQELSTLKGSVTLRDIDVIVTKKIVVAGWNRVNRADFAFCRIEMTEQQWHDVEFSDRAKAVSGLCGELVVIDEDDEAYQYIVLPPDNSPLLTQTSLLPEEVPF